MKQVYIKHSITIRDYEKLLQFRQGQHIFFKVDFFPTSVLSPISLKKIIKLFKSLLFSVFLTLVFFICLDKFANDSFYDVCCAFHIHLTAILTTKDILYVPKRYVPERAVGRYVQLKSGPSTAALVTADKEHTSGCFQPTQPSATNSNPNPFIFS